MRILKTTIQPTDSRIWNTNITDDCSKLLKDDNICWSISRFNACFVVFCVCKAASVMFNIVSIHAGIKTISKTK
jgi:hypothetical protein